MMVILVRRRPRDQGYPRSWSVERQSHEHGGAGTLVLAELDAAVVALHHRAAERQPEPGAGNGPVPGPADAVQAGEHLLAFLLRDVAAGVGDREFGGPPD